MPDPENNPIGLDARPVAGIYRNVPESVYHSSAWPFASSSRLRRMAETSPAMVRWEMNNPQPETRANKLRHAYHSAILTPEVFDAEYIQTDKCAAVKRDGKPCDNPGNIYWNGKWYCGTKSHAPGEDESAQLGKKILTAEEYTSVLEVAQAVQSHESVSAMLAGCEREVSILWQDKETGIWIKGRIDMLGASYLGDLKSSVSAASDSFSASIARYGYHQQISLYMDGLEAVGRPVELGAIIPFETEPPRESWQVAVYTLEADDLEIGRRQNRELIRRYVECEQSGNWPGYGVKAQSIPLPDWFRRKQERA